MKRAVGSTNFSAASLKTGPSRNLNKLNNSPGNGNADIYWMDAGFIRDLKEKALVD